MRKLGLIAGGGGLPVALARRCVAAQRPLYVIRLAGFGDARLEAFDGETRPILDLDGGMAALKRQGCGAVCFAGAVDRPNLEGADLPEDIIAARGGDDALLSVIVARFQAEGFVVEGAHEVMDGLTLAPGPLGRMSPSVADEADIQRALRVARAIGALDVGQGAVCRDGSVLAVEAREGTDAMLRRVTPAEIRRGVLAKVSKPGQDLRVDLPTIGPTTVELAATAGLAGIVGEVGRVVVVDRIDTIRLADARGLFVVGLPVP